MAGEEKSTHKDSDKKKDGVWVGRRKVQLSEDEKSPHRKLGGAGLSQTCQPGFQAVLAIPCFVLGSTTHFEEI